MKRFFTLSILAAAVLATGCTRIETGEVGVRVGFDKQVQSGELLPGSFNQVLIGDVLTFPIKDVNVVLENMTPVAVFFAGSILVTLGMAVIASGIILVNNLIHRYWKPLTWFKYEYKAVYFDPGTGERINKSEEPTLETKDTK